MRKYYIAMALIAVLGAASFGVHYVVSKDRIADQQTLNDIQLLQEKIRGYTEKNKKLPSSLSDLSLSQQKVATRLNKYDYNPMGLSRDELDYVYEICAHFKTANPERSIGYSEETSYVDSFTAHKKGRHCFKLKAYAPPSGRFD